MAAAVPQLPYPETPKVRWPFLEEKATFRNSKKRLDVLWNRSNVMSHSFAEEQPQSYMALCATQDHEDSAARLVVDIAFHEPNL